MNTTAKTWRIMGMFFSGGEFLIMMGTSREECEAKFPDALSEHSHGDMKKVESAWLEEWARDCCSGELTWVPRVELPLRRLRLRAAAMKHHATHPKQTSERRKSQVRRTKPMTKRQERVYLFIADFIAERGYSPSLREIMNGLDFQCTHSVVIHLRPLLRKGKITWNPGQSRTLRIVEEVTS